MALCRHYAYTSEMVRVAPGALRSLLAALSLLTGAAVAMFSWPWYQRAPAIPMKDRVLGALLAIAAGLVVTGLLLELLAGLPIVSWFATWTHNLAVRGRPKSPVAAWRELRARDEGTKHWRERRKESLAPPDAPDPARPSDGESHNARLYANIALDHHERGDEDPPDYHPAPAGRPAHPWQLPASALTPDIERLLVNVRQYSQETGKVSARLDLLRVKIQEAHRSGQITFEQSVDLWKAIEWQVRSAAARFARPKIAKRWDGIRLGDEATEELLDQIFGPEKPNS